MRNKFKTGLYHLFEVYCREFKIVLHDGGIILFLTFLPLVYPILYSLIYNPEVVRDVPFVVVDNDRSAVSRELVRNLDASDEARLLGYASDLNEARHAVNSHQAFAILEIPGDFGKKIGRDEQATAALYCEMSLLLRYRGFLVASTEVMQSMGAELMAQKVDELVPLAETVVNGDLLPINNISMGNIENGFDSFIMPGVIILILHQCIVLVVGMAGGAKRENPYLIGFNPINETRSVLGTMVGQSLCYMTILVLPVIFMLHYVPLIFRFPMAGNFLEEMAFIMPMVIACLGIGFVFQAFVTEREEVFVSWVATSLIFLLVSGLIWPRYDMWGIWQALGAICPSTWGVEGFIKMNSNGASLAQVAPAYINLWILAVIWWGLGFCAQKWVVRPKIARLMSTRLKNIEDI